ncbi:MAG: metal-binding protein [Clostridiaceae bacterium]|nr:metal-binding protein [Clostridiaceae bacterium]
MKSATILLETLACPSCMQKIDKAVKSVDGVDKESVNVMFNASKGKLQFDPEKTTIDNITDAIGKIGYEVKKTVVR